MQEQFVAAALVQSKSLLHERFGLFVPPQLKKHPGPRVEVGRVVWRQFTGFFRHFIGQRQFFVFFAQVIAVIVENHRIVRIVL